MSSPTISSNPLLDPKYSDINNSNDPIALNIVSNFTSIYNNCVIFSNQSDAAPDVDILDNAATNIQNQYKNITNILSPCINNITPSPQKCTNPECKWARYTEEIFMR